MLTRLWLLVLVIMVAGCAATGKPFTKPEMPSANEGRIYVYRPMRFIEGGVYPTVKIDYKEVGNLKTGGYITRPLGFGPHLLTLSGSFFQWGFSQRTYHIDVNPGHIYYYRLLPTMRGEGNITYLGYTFDQVGEVQALGELKKLNESQ